MADESARRAYERLTVQLHRYIRSGHADAPEADAVRDQMDAPWDRLSPEERRNLDLLSEDLYELADDRRVVPLDSGDTSASILQEAEAALWRRDYHRTLELLRKVVATAVSADERLYMLGRCWDELGFSYAACEFFDRAYDLRKRAIYAVMALSALVRAGERDEAIDRIKAIENDENATPALRLRAAALLFQTAESADTSQARVVFRRVVALVERGADDQDVVSSIRAAALLAAGFSYEHLGDPVKALQAFDKALKIHEDDAALIARAFAQLPKNRPAALADFQRAINLGTSLPWPFLYLAHDALIAGRHERLEELCIEGLWRPLTAPLRAQFYEWAAIAAAQLGRRPDVVRDRFTRARLENPFEPRIAQNADAYEAAIGAATRPMADGQMEEPTRWEYPQQLDDAVARNSLSRHAIRMLDAAA